MCLCEEYEQTVDHLLFRLQEINEAKLWIDKTNKKNLVAIGQRLFWNTC
jgi:hypothetical protein